MVLDQILEVFTTVGEWIPGAVNQMIPIFGLLLLPTVVKVSSPLWASSHARDSVFPSSFSAWASSSAF